MSDRISPDDPPRRRSSGRFQQAYWSHAAEEANWEDEVDAEDDGDDTQHDKAYLSDSCGSDEEFSDVVVCAFVAAGCS